MQDHDETLDDARSIAQRVRQLLDSQGIAKRQQASEIQRILGLSYSQALRKIKGENPWTINQLRAVASEFGESAALLVDHSAEIVAEPDFVDGPTPSLLTIDGRDYECHVEIGARIAGSHSTQFVAIEDGARWRIHPRESAPDGIKFSVLKIGIQVREVEVPVIAVVDDEPAITEQICLYLDRSGFIAKGYTSHRDFLADVAHTRYDAVIVDWLLDGVTARALIDEIVRPGETAPLIYLLTGKIATGEASEAEMVDMIQKFDISPIEKPVRLPWFVAELNRRLSRRKE